VLFHKNYYIKYNKFVKVLAISLQSQFSPHQVGNVPDVNIQTGC